MITVMTFRRMYGGPQKRSGRNTYQTPLYNWPGASRTDPPADPLATLLRHSCFVHSCFVSCAHGCAHSRRLQFPQRVNPVATRDCRVRKFQVSRHRAISSEGYHVMTTGVQPVCHGDHIKIIHVHRFTAHCVQSRVFNQKQF
jgi:hypothetical protein